MKLLKALTVFLILALAFVACDEKEGEKDVSNGDFSSGPDTHEKITQEYFGYMGELVGAMGTIRDKEAAQACALKLKELQPEFVATFDRVNALPAPTHDEKSASQRAFSDMMEQTDAKLDAFEDAHKENPLSAEVIAEIDLVMKNSVLANFIEEGDEVVKIVLGLQTWSELSPVYKHSAN
jgi:hypothetical protein